MCRYVIQTHVWALLLLQPLLGIRKEYHTRYACGFWGIPQRVPPALCAWCGTHTNSGNTKCWGIPQDGCIHMNKSFALQCVVSFVSTAHMSMYLELLEPCSGVFYL